MRLFSAVLFIMTGILLILVPRVLFPTCDFSPIMNSGHAAMMVCNTTGLMALWAGLLTFLSAGVLLLVRVRGVRLTALALIAVAAIFVLFSFTVWPGVCRSATMPCRAGTWLAALLVAGLQLCAVVVAYSGIRREGGDGAQ